MRVLIAKRWRWLPNGRFGASETAHWHQGRGKPLWVAERVEYVTDAAVSRSTCLDFLAA